MQTRKPKPRCLKLHCLWWVLLSSTAIAQSQPPASGTTDQAGTLQEVIVTATKRTESEMKTPESLVVYTPQELEIRDISSMDDYLRTTPGAAFIDRGVAQNSIIFRGITTAPESDYFNTGPTVGVYWDEVAVGGLGLINNTVDIQLVDMERVEVLRGPQGTLFGAGALAGAVRNIPMPPDLTNVEARASVDLSDTAELGGANAQFEGVLNLPLIDNELAVRAVVYEHKLSGYVDNIAGSDPKALYANVSLYDVPQLAQDISHMGATDTVGGRIAVLFKPNDAFNATLSFLEQDTSQDGYPDVSLLTGGYTQARISFGPGVPAAHEGMDDEIQLASLVANYVMPAATIVSVTSRTVEQSDFERDVSPFFGEIPAPQIFTFDTTNWSQEFRLVSNDKKPWGYVVGLYYQFTDVDIARHIYYAGAPAASPFPPGSLSGPYNNIIQYFPETDKNGQRAVFGELSAYLGDKFELTLGGRRFSYTRDENATSDSLGAVSTAVLGNVATGSVFKANLSYYATKELMLYGLWSQGFRPGTFIAPQGPNCDSNGYLTGTNYPLSSGYGPDTMNNFELGAKWADAAGRIQLSADLYRDDWKNIPISVYSTECGGGTVVNGGLARSQGVEAQAKFLVVDGLTVDTNAAWGTAKLLVDVASLDAVSGDRLPGAPEVTGNIGVQYDHMLGGRPAFVRADYSYVGGYYNNFQSTGLETGNYGELSAAIGQTWDRTTFKFYGQNLLNDNAVTFASSLWPDERAYRLRPRTIGFKITYQL